MGYCTETDIEKTIAQALTSATAQTSDSLNTFSNFPSFLILIVISA